jgi:hypothetical protein
MTKRILLSLDDELYEILKSVKGLGGTDAGAVRNILVAYLSERSYFSAKG